MCVEFDSLKKENSVKVSCTCEHKRSDREQRENHREKKRYLCERAHKDKVELLSHLFSLALSLRFGILLNDRHIRTFL